MKNKKETSVCAIFDRLVSTHRSIRQDSREKIILQGHPLRDFSEHCKCLLVSDILKKEEKNLQQLLLEKEKAL